MKIETILNAYSKTIFFTFIGSTGKYGEFINKRYRQYQAFRSRILNEFKEKDDVIEGLFKSLYVQQDEISNLKSQLADCQEKLNQ